MRIQCRLGQSWLDCSGARARVKFDFSATGKGRVIAGTSGGTLFCVGTALLIDSTNFNRLSAEALQFAILFDIMVPVGLAGPMLFLLLHKMRLLAIAHREMSIIATTDSLTEVLNRGAFKMMVDAFLRQATEHKTHAVGAFLIVDADHFKSINDRFGHQGGDEALKIIAQTIHKSLRQGDIVGRIGGEEFGVFLPKAGFDQATTVAERIRQQISAAEFPPDERTNQLSVSVGGVAFRGDTAYDELFRRADKCLYSAKSRGRNMVIFEPLAA